MSHAFEVDLFWSSSVSSDFCVDVVMSADNEVVVFNAPFNDLDENEANSLSNAGAVYVRAKSGNNWINEYKIVSPNRTTDGVFGHHLAVVGTRATNGLALMITARGELSGQGRAYLYTEVDGVFTLKDTITASDGAAGDKFGFSLAGGESFNVAHFMIGAPFKTVNSIANAGQAYHFRYVYSSETISESDVFEITSNNVVRQHILNGSFQNLSTLFWTAVGNTILGIDTNRLSVLRLSTGGSAYQSFTTIVGQTYTAKTDFTADTGIGYLQIGNALGGSELGSDSSSSSVVLMTTFIATATTTYLTLVAGSVFLDKSLFDDVSVVSEALHNHVLNGDFPSNTNFWTDSTNATLAIVSNAMSVTNISTGISYGYQFIPVMVGANYTVTCDFTAVSAIQGALWIDNLAGSFALGSDSSTVTAALSVTFTATDSTVCINLVCQGTSASDQVIFDNVEMHSNNAYFGYTAGMYTGSSAFTDTDGTIAIGSRESDYSGRVHLIGDEEDSLIFTQILYLPFLEANDYFGVSFSEDPDTFAYYPITLNSDGSTVVVGAHGAETNGNVTVWEGTPAAADYAIVKTYLGSDILLAGETTEPYFGSSVHMTDTVLAIGAQEYDTVVGSDNDRGAVYHAHKENGVWGTLEKLPQPSTNNDKDFFGYKPYVTDTYIAVAISDFFANVDDQGAVVVYQIEGGPVISATDEEAQEPVDYFLIDVPCRKRA